MVPMLIKISLPEHVGKHSNMELHIGDARFNPFSYHLHLSGISILYDAGAIKEATFLKTADLEAEVNPIALLQGKLVCRSLHIDKLAVTLIRYPNGKYNLSQLLDTSTAAAQADEAFKLPFLYSFNNILVTDSTVVFDDRQLDKIHKAEKINLTLPTLSNFPYRAKTSVSPSFSAVINGSPIQLTGEAAMPDGTGAGQTRLSFDLHSVDLPLYFNYLPLSLPVQLVKGTANGQIQISFIRKEDHSQRLTVFFQLDTKDIEVSTQDHSLGMSLPTARLEGDLQPLTGNLHLQNILFHEPEIRLQPNFSEHSLDSLLPSGNEPSPETRTGKSSPLFALDLFIMDNGILHIDQGRKAQAKTYRSLQLSIKNYTNRSSAAGQDPATPCSFTLSGEQLTPPASFSWQGELNKNNTASGTVRLNRFPASLLGIIFTQEKETSMTGTADMTGDLSVERNQGTAKPFSYSILKGSVKISDLHLFENKREWLRASSFSLGPLDSKGKDLDIGNIFVRDAVLTLRKDHFPHLLDSFLKSRSPYRAHGMDFAGEIILKPGESFRPPLVFNDLSMQANHLETAAKDTKNFSVTGKIDQAGQIKATGTIALNPFRATLAVEFSGMRSEQLLPWYTDSSFLLDGHARLDGIGQLTYPEGTFKGNVTIADALFAGKEAKSKLAWTTADFQDLNFTRRPFHLDIATAEIDHPVLSYSQPDNKTDILAQAASFIRDLFPQYEKRKSAKEPLPPDLLIKEISLKNGTVIYRDPRLDPPWQQEISGLTGRIQNLSRSEAAPPAQYMFTGTIAGSPLMVKGMIDPYADRPSAQANLTVTGLPIAVFKDQLANALSVDTGKGTLDLTLQDTWNQGKEAGEARYLFRGLSPASPSADTALPLALLADKQDIFAANIPLTTPEDKETHPLFSETVAYFKRLIVKSMIAPLLLTTDDFARLAFDDTPDFLPGESTLSDKGKAKLTLYRDLLAAHPRLKLEIAGRVGNSDKKALQAHLMKIEEKRVEAENKQRLAEWNAIKNQKQQPGRHTTIVESTIPASQLAQYAPVFPKQITVSDQDMQNLVRQRSASAYEFFTTKLGVAPDRVDKQANGSPESDEQLNRVHITLRTLVSAATPQGPPADKPAR